MGYRGRLIHPLLLELYRLDLAAMAGDPDGAGALTGGMDPDYREPATLPTDDGLGAANRIEMAPIILPAQIEPDAFNRQQMAAAGDQKTSMAGFTLHFLDLELAGLVDTETGRALIAPGDRVSRILSSAGDVLHVYPNPPGLFVQEATPIGFGLGGDRNLLLLRCRSRERSL